MTTALHNNRTTTPLTEARRESLDRITRASWQRAVAYARRLIADGRYVGGRDAEDIVQDSLVRLAEKACYDLAGDCTGLLMRFVRNTVRWCGQKKRDASLNAPTDDGGGEVLDLVPDRRQHQPDSYAGRNALWREIVAAIGDLTGSEMDRARYAVRCLRPECFKGLMADPEWMETIRHAGRRRGAKAWDDRPWLEAAGGPGVCLDDDPDDAYRPVPELADGSAWWLKLDPCGQHLMEWADGGQTHHSTLPPPAAAEDAASRERKEAAPADTASEGGRGRREAVRLRRGQASTARCWRLLSGRPKGVNGTT